MKPASVVCLVILLLQSIHTVAGEATAPLPAPNTAAMEINDATAESVAPSALQVDAATPTANGTADPIEPLEQLVIDLDEGPEDVNGPPGFETSAHVSRAIQRYLHQSGADVPPPSALRDSPADAYPFDDNETLTFTYEVGDVDGDGTEDVLMNTYCVATLCDFEPPGGASAPRVAAEQWCGTRHQLSVASGDDGSRLWVKNLGREETRGDLSGVDRVERVIDDGEKKACEVEYIIGTIPLPSGKEGILSYGYAMDHKFIYAAGVRADRVNHRLALIDSSTGDELWVRYDTGYVMKYDLCAENEVSAECRIQRQAEQFYAAFRHGPESSVVAEKMLINVLLQRAPASAHSDNTTHSSLIIQEVGFAITKGNANIHVPGSSSSYRWWDHYAPMEYLERLDPETGETNWRVKSFEPDVDRSLQPKLIPDQRFAFAHDLYFKHNDPWNYLHDYPSQAFSPANGQREGAMDYYWRDAACCGDVTGDGVPDVVYTTVEWNPQVLQEGGNCQTVALGVVAFDGNDGHRLYQQTTMAGVPRFFDCNPENAYDGQSIHLKPAGDINGDGAEDFLSVHNIAEEAYRRVIMVHDGPTGAILWSHETPQKLMLLPMGDADGDGGEDLLAFQWTDWDYPTYRYYHTVNVTHQHLRVISGSTGEVIWSRPTLNAAIDLYYTLDLMSRFGLPDINGDGVSDVLIDQPHVLSDLTVIHRRSYLSGSDGSILSKFDDVGLYSIPLWLGDPTGDGVDDFGMISGDPLDIWFTAYDGQSGSALWSIRVIQLHQADYTMAVPKARVHHLEAETGSILLLNLQIVVAKAFETLHYPQLLAIHSNGTVAWREPSFIQYETAAQAGRTPAGKALDRLLLEPSLGERLMELPGANAAAKSISSVIAFVAALGVTQVAGRIIIHRRSR